LAGLATHAFTMGGAISAMVSFVVAGVVLVVLFVTLAVGLGRMQERTVRSLRAGTRELKSWGGVILVVVGLWFVVLAAEAEFFSRIFRV
jgi:cytochrome c biogenesis protein CcdA